MKKFFGLVILLITFISAGAQEFMAGAAYRVITPDPLLPVSGGAGIPNPASVKKGE